MRKFFKGLICGMLALTLTMPAGTMPNTVMERDVYAATSTAVSEGRCGDNVKYTYDSATKTLTISGTGEMWDEIKFPKAVWDAENLIIEKGVTTIGAYSFYGKILALKNVQIADTVTTIKEFAFPSIEDTVEIPASVTKVEENAICTGKKIIIKGDLKGYEKCSIGGVNTEEIVIGGSAEDLGKASMYINRKDAVITIAEGNQKCTIENGCIVSNDGKEVYYYVSGSTKVKIADTVEKICDAAFFDMGIKEVTFGKGIKEIGNNAFQCNKIKKVKFPKSLKKVGEYAFGSNSIKTATFNKKVTIGNSAFNKKAVIRNNAGMRKTSTSIYNSYTSSNKCYINFAKVSGAKGYVIKIKAGKKTYKYNTTTNSFKKALDKNIKKYYQTVEDDYEEDSKVAITVTVRPYEVVKGKKVYGKWSQKSILDM